MPKPKSEVDLLADFAALLDTTKTVKSRKLRATVLKNVLERTPRLTKFLRYALDPLYQYRFGPDDVDGAIAEGRIRSGLFDLLDHARWRQSGPKLSASRWVSLTNFYAEPLREAANAIIKKDLFRYRLGVNLVNDVLVKLNHKPINIVQGACGTSYRGKKPKGWYGSEEIVGLRCFAVLGKYPLLLSRSGSELIQFDSIQLELTEYEGEPYVLDGKIAVNDRAASDFFEADEAVRKGNTRFNPKSCTLHVFDCIPLDDFLGGKGQETFKVRLGRLYSIVGEFDQEFIRPVPQVKLTSKKVYKQLLKKAREREWQGIVFRRNSRYVSGETRNIQIKDLDYADS